MGVEPGRLYVAMSEVGSVVLRIDRVWTSWLVFLFPARWVTWFCLVVSCSVLAITELLFLVAFSLCVGFSVAGHGLC
jgi:hypothetical protein